MIRYIAHHASYAWRMTPRRERWQVVAVTATYIMLLPMFGWRKDYRAQVREWRDTNDAV